MHQQRFQHLPSSAHTLDYSIVQFGTYQYMLLYQGVKPSGGVPSFFSCLVGGEALYPLGKEDRHLTVDAMQIYMEQGPKYHSEIKSLAAGHVLVMCQYTGPTPFIAMVMVVAAEQS